MDINWIVLYNNDCIHEQSSNSVSKQKMICIIDCYTDEPAGLGVPPYLGTYPRYIAGKYIEQGIDVKYLTIDDLRLALK